MRPIRKKPARLQGQGIRGRSARLRRGERDGPEGTIAAVDEEGVVFAAGGGGALVLDAAGDGGEGVLGTLTQAGALERSEVDMKGLLEEKERGGLEGGGRGEAAADRDVGGKDDVEIGDCVSGASELIDDAEGVEGPCAGRVAQGLGRDGVAQVDAGNEIGE